MTDLENWDEFLNALQLSIDTKIKEDGASFILTNEEVISISFSKKPKADERWEYFEKLTEGTWKRSENGIWFYQIPRDSFDINDLSKFLLITRLNKNNLLKIAELHSEYKKYVDKIFDRLPKKNQGMIYSMDHARQFIFEKMSQNNMTLLKLAHQTGLSMVTLSNFKSGKDIRLSNFLKITEALGIGVKISD